MNTKPELSKDDIRAIYHQGEDAVVELIMSLITTINALYEKAQRLEDQLTKNSNNSNKPPSSDGLSKPSPKSLRKRHGRKSGGQAGHAGYTLKAVGKPDRIESHPVFECTCCHNDLKEVSVDNYEKRQVFDLPPQLKIMVTEHQAEIKTCPYCGERNKAAFPRGITQPVQYGDEIKSLAVYLNQVQLIPLQRTVEILETLFGHAPSQASLMSACQELTEHIQPVIASIKTHLKGKAAVVHFDETGVRVEGKLHWLHSASTAQLTYYQVHPKRGHKAMDADGILPELSGTAVHDGWMSYFRYEIGHALCNVHHLRRLKFLEERYPQAWVTEMADLLIRMKTAVEDAEVKGLKSFPQDMYEDFLRQYDNLVALGFQSNPAPVRAETEHKKRGRVKQNPARNLLDEFKNHKSAVLAFMTDFKIPFDNNLAERDIRMMKVKQKISGCFRTLDGAQTFSLIRSYVSTARKNGINIIDALRRAFAGYPYLPVFVD